MVNVFPHFEDMLSTQS